MRRIHAGFAVAVSLGLLTAVLADDKQATPHVHRSPAMEKCIEACAACTNECEGCFVHCTNLVASGKKDHIATLRTCVDCGDLCALAGKIMARNGALIGASCEGCAKGCDDCATACEKFPDDSHMKACAKSCRDCSKACREMLKETASASARGTE